VLLNIIIRDRENSPENGCYHRFLWYANLENKTPAVRFQNFRQFFALSTYRIEMHQSRPIAWCREGQKVTLVAVIGEFRSDLSITRKTDGNFGNVPRVFCFPKSRININGGNQNGHRRLNLHNFTWSVTWIGYYRDCNQCCDWWIQWRRSKMIGSCNCPNRGVWLQPTDQLHCPITTMQIRVT